MSTAHYYPGQELGSKFEKSHYSYLKLALLTIFCVVTVGLFPLAFIGYGVNFTDEPYSIRTLIQPDAIGKLSLLTTLLGQKWIAVFGNSLRSLRLLSYLLIEAQILVASLFFVRKNNLYVMLPAVVMSTICSSSISAFIYNSYLTSTLLFILIFLCIFKFSENFTKNKNVTLFLVGIITGISILGRFPTFLLVPYLLLVFSSLAFFEEKRLPQISQILHICFWFISGCFLTIFIFVSIISTPAEYLHLMLTSVINMEGSDHSFNLLASHIYRDGVVIFRSLLILTALYAGFRLLYFLMNGISWLSEIIAGCIFFGILENACRHNCYDKSYSLNTSALILWAVIFIFVELIRKKHISTAICLLLIPGLSLVMTAGSDTGLQKMARLLILFIPFLAVTFIDKIQVPARGFLIFLFLTLTIFSVYHRMTWFYGDTGNIYELNSVSDNSKLSGIKTTADRIKLIHDVKSALGFDNTNQENIIYFGRAGQMFFYLFGGNLLQNQRFYLQPDDPNVLKELAQRIITEHPKVVVLNGNPDLPDWPKNISYQQDTKSLEILLMSNYYKKKVDTRIYSVWY